MGLPYQLANKKVFYKNRPSYWWLKFNRNTFLTRPGVYLVRPSRITSQPGSRIQDAGSIPSYKKKYSITTIQCQHSNIIQPKLSNNKCTSTQAHQYTNTQAQKYTSKQIHQYTCAQVHMCTSTLVHKCTSTQVHKYTSTLVKSSQFHK